MAEFKSKPVTIYAPAETVFGKLSNLENLKSLLENVPEESIPEDKRDLFNQIELTPETITIPGGPVGAITLRVTERVAPALVRLSGEGTPVPLHLALSITPLGADSCEAQVSIDLAVPAMLKPMISGPVQKMCDQFASVLCAVPFK